MAAVAGQRCTTEHACWGLVSVSMCLVLLTVWELFVFFMLHVCVCRWFLLMLLLSYYKCYSNKAITKLD